MSEQEYQDNLKSLFREDFDLANAFANEYHKDSLADKNTLITRAQAALGRHEGLQGVATASNVFPLMNAFDIPESGVRNLVDMRSPSNWTRMSTKALMDAAVKGGYVKPLAQDATEEQKQEQRQNFDNFLKLLGTASTDQERRNILRDYENTEFLKDPLGWSQKIINDFLFRTYSKRAKEQILKGDGASNWGQMSGQDMSTLGLDIGANSAFGAGAATLGKLAAGNALRSGTNIVGSDIAAGVLGGLTDVGNRAMNTDEGIRPYEVVTEPVVAGVSNALFTPGAVRQGISSGMAMMRGGKVGDMSRRSAMAKAADWLANKTGWDEAELAQLFKEMGANGDFATAPMSASTRKKITEMKEIWDDGLTDSPGETYSLWDELQALYEGSSRNPIIKETKDGVSPTFFSREDLGRGPTKQEFMRALDKKIADIQGELKNSAGADEAPALKRKLKYFENARDMFGNNLMDPEDVLYKVDKPSPFMFERNPEFKPGSGTEFVLRDATVDQDLRLMREYARKAKEGKIVDATGPMADELSRLKEKYPEFGRFVDNMRTVHNGRGVTKYENGIGDGITEGNQYMYGGTFFPSRYVMHGFFGGNVPFGMSRQAAENLGKSTTEAILTGAVKPGVTFAGMERFSRPDNSFEAVSERMKKLRELKPEATEAALNWKFDNRIDPEKQLNEAERNLVNQYRAMLLNEAMNGR